MLAADYKAEPERKSILPEDKYNSTNFLTLWDFEGVFKYSPMFYGFYTNKDTNQKGYRLPLAYFFTGLVVYVYSFVATLRKMAENSRMSKLSEKDDECIFSWKLFTGWDYMIGNAETAHNRVASIIMSFKEALLEEAEKKREAQNWKVIGRRVLVNLGVLGLLALSAFAVFKVVERSNEKEASSTTWRRNEITVVMSLISLLFPILFELLGYFEQYHPRKQLRLQLARIMVLNLLNLYSLMFALFGKIDKMTEALKSYKPEDIPKIPVDFEVTTANILKLSTTQLVTYQTENNMTNCYMNCTTQEMIASNLVNAIIANISTTILPKLATTFNLTLKSNPIYDYSNMTEMYSNESISSFSTAIYYNLTMLNNENVTMFNNNDSFTTEINFESYFFGALEDFLNYFVSPNFDDNNTNVISTDFNNLTSIKCNITNTSNTDSFELFKSTMSPIFNSTYENIENTLENLYNEITTTANSVTENIIQPDCKLHCEIEVTELNETIEVNSIDLPDYKNRSRLRSLCWETMFGQELVKLTVMDLVFTVLSTLAIDFLRGLFVRYMNSCWCWDLEKKFPQYGDFKVAENILHLVNNQGMVWMGMFFSPGLVILNLFKLYIMMYLRSWAVLTCNVPHEVIFRASRSNNFYFALLLMMLFLCVLPVGYTIVGLEPSWHCGPFSNYNKIVHIFTRTIKGSLPTSTHKILDYTASPGIVIPLLVLLILIIYYLISLTSALREANTDLKIQLRRERTEERRKMFQIADRRRRGGSEGSGELGNNPFGKWKKLLQGLPPGKSFDETTKQESLEHAQQEQKETKPDNGKGMLSKFIFRALKTRKQSVSDEDSQQVQDDGTDTEQHDSLPDDAVSVKEAKQQVAKKSETTGFNKITTTQRNATPKLESVRKASTESSDTKHVKIKEGLPTGAYQKRRDVYESKKIKSNKSPTKSSIKETRQDSVQSNWSDNIPVITISKTESSECILETKNNVIKETKKVMETKNKQTEISNKKSVEIPKKTNFNEPQNIQNVASTSRHERNIPIEVEPRADKDVFKPRIKYVLKKQITEIEQDETLSNKSRSSVCKEAQKQFKTTSESTQTTDTTKTESSTDYKDSTFSN